MKAKGSVDTPGATSQTDNGLSIDDGQVKKIKMQKAFAPPPMTATSHADNSVNASKASNGGTGADDDEAKRLEEAMKEADRLEEERIKRQQEEEEAAELER